MRTMAKPLEVDQVWQERIAEQLEGMQYGQVVVTVHDGQIVQIDRTERTRYQLGTAKLSKPEELSGKLQHAISGNKGQSKAL